MNKRHLWIILTILVIGAGVAGLLDYFASQSVLRQVHDDWAAIATAHLIVDHLEASDDVWPSGWADLRDDYAAWGDEEREAVPFDELPERIEVRWTAQSRDVLSEALARPDEAPQVIRRRGEPPGDWASNDPNQIIVNYLTSPRTEIGPPNWMPPERQAEPGASE